MLMYSIQEKLDALVEQYQTETAPPEPEPEPPTVPIIEERHWYQHSLLIAPTQTGKTNVIQWRIANRLPQVAAGRASIVLMEPKGVLTADILNLAQTYQMRDRVVILDPADMPVSINIFDKGNGSALALNETVARIVRVVGTLSSEFTGFQRDAMTFAVQAMFSSPEPANIRTLIRILRSGKEALQLDKLPASARDYFEFDFKESDGRFIISRLNSLLVNPVFETLFSGDRTTFDMLEEIQAGKLIVVNCASPALGGDSTFYAHFWIEEVQRCVFPRLAMPAERRTPTTFIIDEAQDYIAEDRHIAALLAQAAEARIGMMFGMHYLGQLTDAYVRDAVAVNTNLKFAARPATDVPTLARAMNTDSDFLTSLPAYTFAYRGPGMQDPIRVKFPQVDFGKMPRMSEEQYVELRQENKRRYAYDPEEEAAQRAYREYEDHWHLGTISTPEEELAACHEAVREATARKEWNLVEIHKTKIIPHFEYQVRTGDTRLHVDPETGDWIPAPDNNPSGTDTVSPLATPEPPQRTDSADESASHWGGTIKS
jgi:hypothetical protein